MNQPGKDTIPATFQEMKKSLPLLLLIAIGLIFIFYHYPKPVLHPDSVMYASSGDGLKNYYTYAGHLRNNHAGVNFEGMNHPYGEHFMYTDSHPALVLLFKPLLKIFPGLSDYSIAILNWLMMASVLLTFIAVFFLLRDLGIRDWFALIFSVGISLLSPQIFRMGGHLALSYSVAIPFSWLLLIRSLKNPSRKGLPWLLLINNLWWFFIHAYLGMIITFFLLMIVLFSYFTTRDRSGKLTGFLRQLGALILPVVVFFLFVKFTDTHSGRTANPSGFFLYVAEADDVFVPNHPPLRPWLDEITGNGIRQQWEAWSYVGLFTALLTLFFVFAALTSLVRRKPTLLSRFFGSRYLNMSLLAAFVVLLFAMAVPFRQIPALVDALPVLKQFRALGRFTWPFFFVSTAFSAWVVNQLYVTAVSGRQRIAAIVLALAAAVMNVAEALPYHREMAYNITRSSNLFLRENLSEAFNAAIDAVNPEEYQAIVALPFFYQGSESYSRPGQETTTRLATLLSYHTGLPMVNANLTRTSVQESKNIVQMVSPDYYEKAIAADLTDTRPFLVITTTDPLTAYEGMMLKKCTPVTGNPEVSLWKLPLNSLFSSSEREVHAGFLNQKTALQQLNGFYVTDSGFLYYDSFEKQSAAKVFRGTGGFEGPKKGKNVLAEFAPGTFLKDKTYHLSAWMYNGHQDALNLYFRFIVEEYNETEDRWEQTTCFPDQSETINGNWSLAEIPFRVSSPGNRIYIVTIGARDAKGPVYIDDLLIREEAMDVYREEGDFLFFNNHRIDLR